MQDEKIIHDRLSGYDDIVRNNIDIYDHMIDEMIELKIIAAVYKYNLEDWVENRLDKWHGTRKDILKQIYTILQGFKV